MKFKAVIFDLDGTLLDSLQDLADTMNTVLASRNLPRHSTDNYKLLVGYGMQELVARAVPEKERSNTELIGELQEEMKELYDKNWKHNTRPYRGIPQMLDQLSGMPLKTAVLSNKPDHFTRLCVDTLLSSWTFDRVMGHHEGIAHKPDPQGALLIAEEFEIRPADILYVGDSSVDMKTATAAGMYPLGVLWGFRSREELLESGARQLAEEPEDIIRSLQQH
ncbi:HAD family hydrolase [Prosthecochloris sp. N3]|uniref:phosphoglycolate phosphatase n=1 Tax=Prosthecochloris ethylica TaxID=2743976 RepID=A0ABR9XPU0_9CHLB|nr:MULTISPECIES: HAD family hydrolase [Prosthecochloris]MBF0586152.1 HAD family hydrolase [Prosthecochloris ethylica]MBF0635858.1 HAD family hydrolase [Prosthecochloris ethylica]NUK47467.1 HAD family hydrolase [Prosthecochloris ethylica]RNA65014.1 HAD family hydrolase [Prosthecochloris sp. ZM_2]